MKLSLALTLSIVLAGRILRVRSSWFLMTGPTTILLRLTGSLMLVKVSWWQCDGMKLLCCMLCRMLSMCRLRILYGWIRRLTTPKWVCLKLRSTGKVGWRLEKDWKGQ